MIRLLFLHIILIVVIFQINCQEIEIANLNSNPILTLRIKSCKIQTGNVYIIHPINTTNLELTINSLTNLAYKKINNHLSEIVKLKIKLLYSNFIQIQPRKRLARSLNLIGTTWKWISGSPDAEDLHIINTTLNNLIESNNQQYKVNEQIGKRLESLTRAVNKVIESKHENQIILNEIETITTIINIDLINKILEEIQDAILWTKISVANSKILTTQEIHTIRVLLEDQGVYTDLPDEALNLVQPKIAVNHETLLYILRVPKLEREESAILQIHPLNNNNSMIRKYPTHLIKSSHGLFTTTKPDEFIQRSSYISKYSDQCISSLILGKKSYCTTRRENSTEAQLITDNQLLVTNAKSELLKTDCGPDNRILEGNFLITFYNCTVTIRNQQFSSISRIVQPSIIQGAMYNLIIHHQLEEDDINYLNNKTITNRKMINHVYLKQFTNQLWHWSLFGGLTLSTIITITLAVFALLYYRQTVRYFISKLTKRDPKSSSQNPIEDA